MTKTLLDSWEIDILWNDAVVELAMTMATLDFPACLYIRELTDWLESRYGSNRFTTRAVAKRLLEINGIERWDNQISYKSRLQSVYMNKSLSARLDDILGCSNTERILHVRGYMMKPEEIWNRVNGEF